MSDAFLIKYAKNGHELAGPFLGIKLMRRIYQKRAYWNNVEVNRAKAASKGRNWRLKNPDKAAVLYKKTYQKFKVKSQAYAKKYRKLHSNEARAMAKAWRQENPQRAYKLKVDWRKNNYPKFRQVTNQRMRDRSAVDPQFRISRNCRTRIGGLIRRAITGNSKERTFDLIGCTPKFLVSYLESRFKAGMSWLNYGRLGWHIDHIKPVSAFDFTKIEQQRACFHYTNLQPLWAIDNIKKGSKILHETV